MNFVFYSLFVFAGTSPLFISKVLASESPSASAQTHLKENYFSSMQKAPLLQHTYGDPLTSQAVLFVFTSLTCPVCNEFHTAILPALKEEVKRNPALALVIRDYPADPLSLRASSMIWANGPEKAKEIENKVFGNRMKWIKDTQEKSLQELVKLVKECALTPKEKEIAVKAFTDTAFLEKIFNHRNKDKEALGIEQVPAAWLVLKDKKNRHHFEIIEIKNVKDLQAIRSLIKEQLARSAR